jgi:hypothetical protein
MKNIVKISLIISGIFAGWSCDYFQLNWTPEYPWKNVMELELGVRAPYRYMTEYEPWFNPLGTLSLVQFAQSDVPQLLTEAQQGNNYAVQYYNRQYNSILPDKEVFYVFPSLYFIITATNAPLQLINNAEKEGVEPFPNMTSEDHVTVNRYKGELLFMRAVAYWYLARLYAPPFDPQGENGGRYFVLRRTYVNDPVELKEAPLGSVAEVWKSIQDDLEEAKELLPESYVTGEGRSRANKFSASAMLCRTYFITGQHEKAKAECDFIIANGATPGGLYDLTEDPIVAFNRTYTDPCREIIWEIAFDNSTSEFDRIPGIFGKNIYNGVRTGNYSTFTMGYTTLKNIGWMVDGTNGDYTETEEARKDKRYTQTWHRYEPYGQPNGDPNSSVQIEQPQVWLDKYFRTTNETSANRYANRPCIRLAEVYLTRAILRFNAGDKPGAAEDINVVRKRAGLDEISAATLTADDIHNERIKELAGENGDRTYYLIGLRLPIGIGDRDPNKFSPINPPYSDYFWQIPETEQRLNQSYKE